MSFDVVITRDTATEGMRELAASIKPQRLATAIGPVVARLVQRNFIGLGTNKRGWPSTGFWSGAAKSTNWSASEAGAVVSVTQVGVRQRWRGGEIRPVKAGALTIPVSPVSYGHVASDFPGLVRIKTAKGTFLGQRDAAAMGRETKTAYRKRAEGMRGNAKSRVRARVVILFKLVKSVMQKADESVLPSAEAIGSEAKGAVVAAVKGRMK